MENVIRPKTVVLPASAEVPSVNLISPPPDQFTHEVTAEQAYYYGSPRKGQRPAGAFAAGTKVILLVRGRGKWCRVADSRGLYVATQCDGLRPLS